MPQKKQSVYSKIAEDILKKIKNDTYAIGSMLPPERVLMETYKVERTTIRRGLELLQRDGHIKKVAGLGSVIMSKEVVSTIENKEVSSSVQSANTISVNSKKASLLALLPENSDKLWISNILDALKELCSKNGTEFTLLESSSKSRISQVCEKNNVTGCVIFFGTEDENIQYFREKGINICFSFCKSNIGKSILPDIQGCCKAAIEHLDSLGHTGIAFIGTDEDSYCQREYRIHFTKEAKNHHAESQIEQFTNIGGNDEKSGFDRLSELIRRSGGKFTAVVTASDKVAQGALKAAKYYKYAVPESICIISLCGFDKDKELTSMRADSYAFASEIFNSCILCPDTLYGITSSIPFSLYQGSTCSKAKDMATSSRRLSDFLL